MTAALLTKADLALMSDLERRVTIPHLTSNRPSRKYEGTAVRFLGDDYPTPFRGEGRDKTFDLGCRFGRHEQEQLAALLALIDDAAELPDSRLFLRTHHGQAAGVDEALAVIVLGVEPVPQSGLYIDVTLTCSAVQFTLEV